MKGLVNNNPFKLFKCEICGKEHYYFGDSGNKCCSIECNNYAYDRNYNKEQLKDLYGLREKYIGTVINTGNTYVILDILDLDTVAYIDIAGFNLYVMPLNWIKELLDMEKRHLKGIETED